ncbi:MAG: stage II sporulation protein M [Peptococcaceae bacterium]|nr:stage II sporulation protein M [Peptococcaceae bacterium]
MKKILFSHIKQYWVIYLTLICVYFTGFVFGIFGVGALSAEKSFQLADFFNKLLQQQPNSIDIIFLRQIAKNNFIIMAGIWLLGLTVIGTPLIYLIVFTRGFVLGFTFAFIVYTKKLAGVGIVLFTIAIPSILTIPCLLLGAGLATIFSFILIQGKFNGHQLRRDFIYYCFASFLVSIAIVSAGVLQGYFSILGVKSFGF